LLTTALTVLSAMADKMRSPAQNRSHQPGVRLTVPENITLLLLSPYAPELNPMENVWDYLRGNQLSMAAWDSYAAILDAYCDACCDAWNSLMSDAKRITSITARDWAQVRT